MSSNKNTAEKEIKKVEKKSKVPLILGLLLILGVSAFGIWYFLSEDKSDVAVNSATGTDSTNGSNTAENPANANINTNQQTAETNSGIDETPVEIKAGTPKTPTDAYKKLYEAVKAKDKETIRSLMTEASIGLGKMQAGQAKKELDEVLANAFTSTTFADKLPPIRDERVKGKFGAIEVYDYSKSQWQDLPFIAENGVWKLAVGNLFAGSFKSPGRGRASIEKENANAASPGRDLKPLTNTNLNNVKPKVIDPLKGKPMPPVKQMPLNQKPPQKP